MTAMMSGRQPLHLVIGSSHYRAPSPSSEATSSNDSPSETDHALFSVLCCFDFESDDPAHLPFHKNEILDIVQQENTGWWAAMRRGGTSLGWIPMAFVRELSEEMTERLLKVVEELRVYEYEAELLYNEPVTRLNDSLYEEPTPSPALYARRYSQQTPSPSLPQNGNTRTIRPLPHAGPPQSSSSSGNSFSTSPSSADIPPSPITPMPLPPPYYGHTFDKPTPPTPRETEDFGLEETSPAPVTVGSRRRRNPMFVDNEVDLQRISRIIETRPGLNFAAPPSSGTVRGRSNKIAQLTGDANASAYIRSQAIPWIQLPGFSDKLQVDQDQIRWGTLRDLVLRLSHDTLAKDPLKIASERLYQDTFLTTFRTFTTADTLFDMLVERYNMAPPQDLNPTEFLEWQEKAQIPTQRQILTIFTMWLEDHRLLEEEPHIARRLTEFLSGLKTYKLSVLAQLIIQTIERLTFANPNDIQPANSPRPKRRKSKSHKGDLLRLEPADLAEQLSIFEHKLYTKITSQELLAHPKMKQGISPATNLTRFNATYDQLAHWVKMSVLNNEQLGKRSDTVDFWIKVAEKCRNINNFASMSSIINALSSTDITRLHLTWAHINRKTQLDTLLKYNDPSGGWAGYRGLVTSAEGPCVPFIAMYLTDMFHIADSYKDSEEQGISFTQRQRWYDAIMAVRKFQTRPYQFGEGSTQKFIRRELNLAMLKETHWFYERSQEVQRSELANADIRKGLEAAGF